MPMPLDHLEANSRRIEAERIAYNSQIQNVNDRINDAATSLAHAERDWAGNAEKIAPFRETVRRLKQERASIRVPARGDPYPEVQKWSARHPKATPADPIKADIRRGETALMAHNRVKAATDTALRTISGIETAPLPTDVIRDSVKAEIQSWGKAPAIINGKLLPPKSLVQVGANVIPLPDALGLVAWAIGDLLVAAVDRLIAPDANAMTAADRAAALEKAYADLAACLRQEAACAMQAELDGQRIERRRSVHPAILLNLNVNPADVYKYMKGAA